MQKLLSLVVICCSMLFEMGLGFAENRLHLGNKNKNLRCFILYCSRFALSLQRFWLLTIDEEEENLQNAARHCADGHDDDG